MKFNPFDMITPSIENTKKLLFPIKFKAWLKLGFISMLAATTGSIGSGANFNIRMPSITNRSDSNPITGSAVDSIKSSLGSVYYLIFPIILLLLILALIMNYITSVFSFIFLEALDTKRTLIKKSFKKNKSLGFSFFLFRIIFGLLLLLAVALLLLPVIIPLATSGFQNYFANFSLTTVLSFLPSFILIILLLIVVSIFFSLVFHFSTVHMYFKRLPTLQSIRATFREMKRKKLEVFVFLIARLIINIVAGIAAVVIILVLIIPVLLIAIPLGIALYFIGLFLSWNILIISIIILIAIAFLVLLWYVFSVIFLPISVFSRYFAINNYKALMKK